MQYSYNYSHVTGYSYIISTNFYVIVGIHIYNAIIAGEYKLSLSVCNISIYL